MKKAVRVTRESETGRNLSFQDSSGSSMSRTDFVKKIEGGKFPGYHVRIVNGLKTPCSNPNGKESDNLG